MDRINEPKIGEFFIVNFLSRFFFVFLYLVVVSSAIFLHGMMGLEIEEMRYWLSGHDELLILLASMTGLFLGFEWGKFNFFEKEKKIKLSKLNVQNFREYFDLFISLAILGVVIYFSLEKKSYSKLSDLSLVQAVLIIYDSILLYRLKTTILSWKFYQIFIFLFCHLLLGFLTIRLAFPLIETHYLISTAFISTLIVSKFRRSILSCLSIFINIASLWILCWYI